MTRRVRVMVLFGGRSAEHDVSRVTAVSVTNALDPSRYEVIPVAITTEGRWLLADDARALLDASPRTLPSAFAVTGRSVRPPSEPGSQIVVADSGGPDVREIQDVDVVLPLLHGPYGEDGTVQGLLELAGLPYVGAGVAGSALCMDKRLMKRALRGCGLPVADEVVHRDGASIAATTDAVASQLGFPCFVKPANMGSSVGVTKAHSSADLAAAIETASVYDEWVLIEAMVEGREIEVAVLGDNPAVASVPGEVRPGAEFYDYADKYENAAAELLIPAPLTNAEVSQVQALAVRAFEACGVESMARVDFFYETTGRARGWVVNELNTIPGFTPISMYPKLWEASGLPYSQLLDRLIELAFERHRRRAQRAGRQR